MMPSINRVKGSLIPITRFNRGEAGRIFDEVNEQGVKIAVRNNEPACVLIKPDVYDHMMELIEDMELLLEAQQREQRDSDARPLDDAMKALGVREEDLAGVEVEIE